MTRRVIDIARSTGRLALGAVLFIIGAAIFVDDLHDFIPEAGWLHWLPDFEPVIIAGFRIEHLYVGALLALIGLIIIALSR